MYENNYPNYENTNTYHYQAPGNGVGSSMGSPAEPPKKEKKMGAGKKILLGIFCGLLFGIFAGIGFTAVTAASDFLLEEGKEAIAMPEVKGGEAEMPGNEAAAEEAAEEEALQENMIASTVTAAPAQAMVTDVTEVVKAVMPSVVSVNNKFVETTSFFRTGIQ